jgi:hypothetical protein
MFYLSLHLLKNRLKRDIELEGYVERWNHVDQRLRGSTNLDAYLKSVRLPTWSEWRQLREYQSKHQIIFFDPQFEGGMPHTHGRFILLPFGFLNGKEKEKIREILRHEAVHIEQRYNPCEMNRVIVDVFKLPITGIQRIKEVGQLFRANPDTNRILYADIRPLYKSNASSLNDIIDSRDHPYEMVAYGRLF